MTAEHEQLLHPWIADFPSVAHYTTYAGLCGILKTRKLWATHYKFLNDTSELSHGREYISNIIREVTASTDMPELCNLWWEALLSCEFFITSFCGIPAEKSDTNNLGKDGLLSQWKGYGNGKGFAIVFDSEQLAKRYQFGLAAVRFEKVLYEHDFEKLKVMPELLRSRAAVIKFAEATLKIISQHDQGVLQSQQTMIKQIEDKGEFWNAIIPLLFLIKHKAFYEENEIRFACMNMMKDSGIETDLSSYSHEVSIEKTAPRLKIDFIPSAINRIIIGPQQGADKMKLSIQYFLSQHGYDPEKIDVVQSSIPFFP